MRRVEWVTSLPALDGRISIRRMSRGPTPRWTARPAGGRASAAARDEFALAAGRVCKRTIAVDVSPAWLLEPIIERSGFTIDATEILETE